MESNGSGTDFFISYTQADADWARWIAVTLEAAGYTTLVQAFDIRPGMDFVHEMQRAATRCRRTIALVSPDYFQSGMGEAEWRAAFTKDPTGEHGLLLPVRVRTCDPPGLLKSRVYIDLVGLDAVAAAAQLVAGVNRRALRPASAPFPGAPATARPLPSSVQPRLTDLWKGGLVAGARAMVKLGRSGRIDVGLLAERGAPTTHELRMTRWLLARRPTESGPPLLDLVRQTPSGDRGWGMGRWAGYALTPAHHDIVAEDLVSFVRRYYSAELARMAMLALGSCGADEFVEDVVHRALEEPPKYGSFAAESLLLMLQATPVDRLVSTGASILDGLDRLVVADGRSLRSTDPIIQALPISHANFLADRWLAVDDNRTWAAADAVGFARATEARQQLVEQAHRQPKRANTLLRAVGLIGGPEAVALLADRIDLPAFRAPAQEALALCLTDAPSADVEMLVDRLLRTNLRNRWAVLLAVGVAGLPQFLPDLVDGLSSDRWDERGMAALGLAELDRSAHLPGIRAVFEQATVPDEVLFSGAAVLRLSDDVGILPRLEKAAVEAGPVAPAIHSHLLTVLSDHGGPAGIDLANVLRWVRSAALPSVAGPELGD